VFYCIFYFTCDRSFIVAPAVDICESRPSGQQAVLVGHLFSCVILGAVKTAPFVCPVSKLGGTRRDVLDDLPTATSPQPISSHTFTSMLIRYSKFTSDQNSLLG